MRVAHKLQQAPQAQRTFDVLQADIFTHYGHGSVVSDLEGLKTVGGFEQLLNRIEGWCSSGPGVGSSRSSEKTSLGSDPPALGCPAGRCPDVVLIEDTDHYPGVLGSRREPGRSRRDARAAAAETLRFDADHEANLRARKPRGGQTSLYASINITLLSGDAETSAINSAGVFHTTYPCASEDSLVKPRCTLMRLTGAFPSNGGVTAV